MIGSKELPNGSQRPFSDKVEDDLPVEEAAFSSFKLPFNIRDGRGEPGGEAINRDGSQPDNSLPPSCHSIFDDLSSKMLCLYTLQGCVVAV